MSAGTGGLATRFDEHQHLSLEATATATGTLVTARARLAGGLSSSWQAELPAGLLELSIETSPPARDFSAEAMGGDRVRLVAAAGDREVVLTELDGRYWAAETAASFTGRVTGLYAVEGTVTFQTFRYEGSEGA